MKNLLKKSITFFVLLLTISFSVNAQAGRKGAEAQMLLNKTKGSNSGVEGSPYSTSDFVSATILPINKPFLVKYDAYKDQMEVKKDGNVLILNKHVKEYVIKLNGNNGTYKILATPPYRALGYFFVVSENQNISLYKKEVKNIEEEKAASYSNMSKTPAKFSKLKTEFYIKYSSEDVVIKLPRSKKQVINLFPDNKDQVKKFIKENNIKFSDEASLTKFVLFLNETISI
jgi:hypothetical protein